MIERIINPNKFKKVLDDMYSFFEEENEEGGHQCGLLHSKESIFTNFGNSILLNWDVFVWANRSEAGKYDALIIFLNEKSVKFNEVIFSEFLWLSKNPKVGYKLFKTAVEFARKNKFKYISLCSVEKNKHSKRNERVYEKLGFLKDTTTYIAKL